MEKFREEEEGNSPQLAASSEFSSNQLPAEHNWSSNYAGGRHQRSDWPPPLGGHQLTNSGAEAGGGGMVTMQINESTLEPEPESDVTDRRLFSLRMQLE
ncbi:hypothetical protein ACLKA6_003329 [Drosophila palustris]